MTEKELSSKHKCSVRTVRRWKQAGAPLHDDAKMRELLASRQHIPEGTSVEQMTRAVREVSQSTLKPSTLPRGAASALGRLEDMEASAFDALQAAMAEADPVATKLARRNWLEIGDSLRRYDLVVDANRRDAGELIPRAQAEQCLQTVGMLIDYAYKQCVQATAGYLNIGSESFEKLEGICAARWIETVETMARMHWGDSIPPWAIQALVSSKAVYDPGTQKRIAQAGEQLKMAHEIDVNFRIADEKYYAKQGKNWEGKWFYAPLNSDLDDYGNPKPEWVEEVKRAAMEDWHKRQSDETRPNAAPVGILQSETATGGSLS